MNFFLIMIAPPLVLILSVFFLFLWGAKGKERVKGEEGKAVTHVTK